MGVQLLNRSTRSVTLTDAGVRYLERVTVILDGLDDANRSVSESGGAPRGRLRVSMPTAFASMHVAPAMGQFMRAYPKISLDLRMEDGVVNLVEDRVDVAVRIGVLETASLIARRLAPNRRLICASPRYLSEHGSPDHPNDLTRHNCLCFTFEDGDRTWRLEKGGDAHAIRVDGTMVANNSEVLRQAATDGAGIVMLPSWLVGEDIRAGRLIQLMPGWIAGHRETDSAIHAVYLPNRRGSQKVRAFVDHLIQRFGASPYWDEGLD